MDEATKVKRAYVIYLNWSSYEITKLRLGSSHSDSKVYSLKHIPIILYFSIGVLKADQDFVEPEVSGARDTRWKEVIKHIQ